MQPDKFCFGKRHYAAFSEFIEYSSLSDAPYQVVHSMGIQKNLLKQAKRHGLNPVSARLAEFNGKTNKRGIELDRIQKGGKEGYEVAKRFAAILPRTQNGKIHGSYEWISLFIAWVVATQSQKTD